MQVEEALEQSPERLIATDTTRGLVTIYFDCTTGSHLLRFIPRATDGELNAAATVAVGAYDDLDTALTIAAVSYGVGETGWMPVSKADLRHAASSKHAPDIEGRRINPHDEAGDNGAGGEGQR